jgi:hypothetical protein
MKIIDNFLPTEYQNAIENLMLSDDFSWYLNPWSVAENNQGIYSNKNVQEAQQFTHAFLREGQVTSDRYPLVSLISYHLMLTENINTTVTRRIKANLNVALRDYPNDKHLTVHTDLPLTQEATTAIYYVNDSDGDTLFFDADGKNEIGRVSPKKGRLVYFDSRTPHAGCLPKEHKFRCVINLNFLKAN